MPIPVAMINRATTIPMYPSSGTEVNFERIRAIIDTVVAAVSLTLSITTAPTAVEFILLPIFLLKTAIHILTPIEAMSTMSAVMLNWSGSGWRILSTDERISSPPMSRIINETISAQTYSILP